MKLDHTKSDENIKCRHFAPNINNWRLLMIYPEMFGHLLLICSLFLSMCMKSSEGESLTEPCFFAGMANTGNCIVKRCLTGSYPEFTSGFFGLPGMLSSTDEP